MFRGPLTILLLRLGALGALYSALRIAFWLYNLALFPSPPIRAFLGGIRFDASAIAWSNAPWILWILITPRTGRAWGRVQLALFLMLNAVALFFNCIDLGYFAFSLKRSTADFLQILVSGNDTANLAPAFVHDYWHIAVIYIVSLVALAWSYLRIGRLQITEPASWPWQVGWRLITVALFVLASRGGTQLIPLQSIDAAKYGGGSYLPVVLNTPFTILTTLGKPTLIQRNYMEQAEADALWPVIQDNTRFMDGPIAPWSVWDEGAAHTPLGNAVPPPIAKPNVVVIILESFSALYSGKLAGGEGYMPFLDSLMAQGLNFTNAYANGRRSIDGIPSILASMPQWMDEAFITSPYASLPFTSLASILGNEGYRTSFYHGGRNGTMGFDGFVKSAGFERYVGLNEYDKGEADFDGHWGVRDRPFLQFYARELNKEQQPFLSAVFTLSSHHPYELPKDDAEHFAGGNMPIHPTLRYTDDALRQFFATVRTMPWYDNTLFVITADHTADLERNGSQGHRPIDYWVPLLYYAPKILLPYQVDRVTQHIDIVPTVLDVIGYSKPFFSFGHTAVHSVVQPYAIWSNNGLYTVTSAKQQVQFDGEKILNVLTIIPGMAPDPVEAAAMELHLKAAIQQYNAHMAGSELTIKPEQP